jgi:hypothetical protein
MTDQATTFSEPERKAILTALYVLHALLDACEVLNEGGRDDFSSSDVTRAIEKLETSAGPSAAMVALRNSIQPT